MDVEKESTLVGMTCSDEDENSMNSNYEESHSSTPSQSSPNGSGTTKK